MKMSSTVQENPKSNKANMIHGMNLSKFGSKGLILLLYSERFIGKLQLSERHQ
jgi:hypothetical protein